MKILEFQLFFTAICSLYLGAEETKKLDILVHKGLIEMVQLDSANGVLEGAIRRYQENLDTSKSILVIHSRSEYSSEWILWLIWTKSGVLGCIMFQDTDSPKIIAIKLAQGNSSIPEILKRTKLVTDNIAKNKSVFSRELSNCSISWDVRLGKGKSQSLDSLEIDFPDEGMHEMNKELRTQVDDLIRLITSNAK